MIRRHGRWKSALALLAGLTVVGTTAANGSPIAMTEASWNDEVNVNATLSASEYVGVNYAQAAASNGTMTRLVTTSNFGGVVSTVNTTTAPDRIDSGDDDFDAAGILNLIYFESEARSCARVGTALCPDDPTGPPGVPAFAVSRFNSMEVKTSELLGAWLVRYQGGRNNPIRTTASCTPGSLGMTGVIGGAGVELRNGPTLQAPTVNGTSVTGTARYLGNDHITTLRYESENSINYARSELRMTIYGVGLIPWTLDLLLSRAECGVSKPLGGGVVPALAGGMTMNAVMDEVLAADGEDIELSTLEDGLDQADKPDITTSTTPAAEDLAEGETESAGTSPSTSTAGAPLPEITQHTVTVTSESPSTLNKATTSTHQPGSAASPTRNTSVSATSPSTPPTSQPATSTAATPAIVIPDEPGTLASNARLEDVETITVGGKDLDVVVVKTDELPSDAKRGAQALETWLGGGNAGTAWKTFASDDPDEDGWRWAAINQKTGTVVYIR